MKTPKGTAKIIENAIESLAARAFDRSSQNADRPLTNVEKLLLAAAELSKIVAGRDSDDPLKWLSNQIFRKVWGYRTDFELKSPNRRLREPEWKLTAQGALVRIVVERQKTKKESIREAAAWVARKIPSENAANLMDRPDELTAETLLKWRRGCRKGTIRQYGYCYFDRDGSGKRLIESGEAGWKILIPTIVGRPRDE
jgi:hypothetical protein